MAITFDWMGAVDTDLPFSAFYGGDHTIMVRFMPQYPNAYAGPILAVNGTGSYLFGQGDFNRSPSSKRLVWQVETQRQYPAYPLVAGRWYHLALVRTGNRLTVYMDGKELSPQLTLTGASVPNGSLRLGRCASGQKVDGQEAQFYGMADELAVYSRALTQPELYAQATSGTHLTGTEVGLLAGWVFSPNPLGTLPATLSRPVARSGSTRLIQTSTTWDSVADVRLLPLPSNHVGMELPFTVGEAWQCIQSFAEDPGTHQGYAAFCWDFVLADQPPSGAYPGGSFGAPVYACAPGTVVTVKEDTPPGTAPPGKDKTNLLEAEHEDGEVCGYLHLLKNSVKPWEADTVYNGQPVAQTGDQKFTPNNPHLHLAVTDQPDGTPGFVTIPIAFSNYEIRAVGGTWHPVARGVPQKFDVVRRTGRQLWVVDVSAMSFFFFLVPSVWFKVISQKHTTAFVTVSVSKDGGNFHVVRSEDPYNGSIPPDHVGDWQSRQVRTNTQDRIFLWWLGKTADGTDFWNKNGRYVFRITAVDPDGNASMVQFASVTIQWHGLRITCIRKANRDDPTQRIQAVGGTQSDRGRWKLSLDDAIAEVESGQRFYVEQPEGDRVEVVVAVSRLGNKYLKTVADGDKPNNLLALPECT